MNGSMHRSWPGDLSRTGSDTGFSWLCSTVRGIDALYSNSLLDGLLSDLDGRRRLDLIALDMADLGIAMPAIASEPVFEPDANIPTALGWLYVAEGSNLGAAFLLKEAES